MKKNLVQMLLFASFYAIDSSAQNNQDFYYLQDNKTHAITKVAGKYLVEYPNDTLQPIPEPGQKIGLTMYLVSDTSNLDTLPHFVTPTYKGRGNDLNYARDIVMQFNENTSAAAKDSLIANYNLTFVRSTVSYDMYKVIGDALQVSKSIYETGLVDYCHPNFIGKMNLFGYYPNDQFFNKQWYLHDTLQLTNDGKMTVGDADIDVPEAWDITKGSSAITVAVLDLGLTSDHYDLPNTRQVRLAGSNFGAPYDGTTNINDPSPVSSTTTGNYNHGNAVAGIIAATQDNNQGISGIAPLCKIMPVKLPLLDVAPFDVYADAITFAARKYANIICISWGNSDPYKPTHIAIMDVVKKTNTLVVIATGNNANNVAHDSGFVQFPGNAVIEEVITVGASDRQNKQANYSPYGDEIELVAPSHTAFPWQINGESANVWTIDIPGTNLGYNPWRDTIKPVQLPLLNEYLPISGTNYHAYTGRFGGTSASAPQVAGVAALMITANPCLSAKQCKEIMQATADKIGGYDYTFSGHIPGVPKDLGYSKELGYGKVNAYKAVKAAQNAYIARSLDLVYMKDNFSDVGLVGVGGTGGGDNSPDIWVRDTNDGLINYVHQNPEFTIGQPVFAYVRIRNKSCYTFNPSAITPQKISLYWSKASSWASWPSNWDGSSAAIGNKIGTVNIPIIPAGGYAIIEFPWTLIDPYVNKTWNSCLLARIEGQETTDPLSDHIIINPGRLDMDVRENNNVAMRNLTIVDTKKGIKVGTSGLLVGNVSAAPHKLNIGLNVPLSLGGGILPNLTSEAEVRLSFDSLGWSIVEASGALNQQGVKILANRQIELKSPNVLLSDIDFPAETRIPIDVSFNFLCDEQTSNTRYEYVISQAFTDTPDMVLGAESYEINKTIRTVFNAQAGNDITINNGSNTVLNAQQIGEDAVYKWYDLDGNFLYNGISYTVAPIINTQYRLEVTSLEDGFKDYDDVAIVVRQQFINSISPNPATTQSTLSYEASSANTASLQVLRSDATTYATYTLDPAQNSYSINTSNYATGVYTIVLYADGQAVDSKTLQVN